MTTMMILDVLQVALLAFIAVMVWGIGEKMAEKEKDE
jgi:hypothetical protein|tara:strand:+ start:326 stop:436 length:111 start_codon:yes stop_codon:yes gene_type:complete